MVFPPEYETKETQNPGQRVRGLQREQLQAKPEDHKHHDEALLYEERLSGQQRRRILRLSR